MTKPSPAISAYMSDNGAKGGNANTDAQTEARRQNIAKAHAAHRRKPCKECGGLDNPNCITCQRREYRRRYRLRKASKNKPKETK